MFRSLETKWTTVNSSDFLPIAVLIENLESRFDVVHGALVLLHLPLHHAEELLELDAAGPVLVSLGHHLLQLVLRGLQSQGPHHGGQLLDGQDIDY